jgi:hypothetical protein
LVLRLLQDRGFLLFRQGCHRNKGVMPTLDEDATQHNKTTYKSINAHELAFPNGDELVVHQAMSFLLSENFFLHPQDVYNHAQYPVLFALSLEHSSEAHKYHQALIRVELILCYVETKANRSQSLFQYIGQHVREDGNE